MQVIDLRYPALTADLLGVVEHLCGRTAVDIIALMTVDAAGVIIDYKAECAYATDTEIVDWVRRSG